MYHFSLSPGPASGSCQTSQVPKVIYKLILGGGKGVKQRGQAAVLSHVPRKALCSSCSSEFRNERGSMGGRTDGRTAAEPVTSSKSMRLLIYPGSGRYGGVQCPLWAAKKTLQSTPRIPTWSGLQSEGTRYKSYLAKAE